jgi:hypothetical protein
MPLSPYAYFNPFEVAFILSTLTKVAVKWDTD